MIVDDDHFMRHIACMPPNGTQTETRQVGRLEVRDDDRNQRHGHGVQSGAVTPLTPCVGWGKGIGAAGLYDKGQSSVNSSLPPRSFGHARRTLRLTPLPLSCDFNVNGPGSIYKRLGWRETSPAENGDLALQEGE